ncbi:MAG: CRISPR-associated helicase Cas3, Yersinia-type [uncultured Sulfurovum sp.]|uniref:CRISPR-associated helicase Cas3, Yersinia-type n=1 Tax=uncultured Sulfurovum sp. TaxID=269237 RepID=A0A6S6SLS7_9BACT|nr:MAG: CRISPR-associated helicase Cas3, Yersinia-type [uncultured Sulfurovum sp.]
MVTFISQCEKNALKRTRRVLDSFANRIGDNTWQTIITEQGLNAVQKLLKKTASKSTAVSCHWIRSRSRSDFLWVVGNKDAFDENGVVAVNYGLTKRFIGEKEIMLDKIYTNTNGQRLDQHLFGVGYLAKKLIEKIVPEDNNLAESVYIAGVWHDIGKIDENFQSWVIKELKKQKKYKDIPDEGVHIDKNTGKFSWQKYPRHNEFSLLLFEILFASNLNKDSLERVKHAIYWHHAKPLRSKKEEIKKVIGIYNKIENFETTYRDTLDTLEGVMSSINEISEEYEEDSLALNPIKRIRFDDIEELIEGVDLPIYKRYSSKEKIEGYGHNIGFNAKNNLARTAIVTADRLISKLTAEALDSHITNKTLESLVEDVLHKDRGLRNEIKACLDGFENKYPNSQRNEQQKETAEELSDEEITVGVLNGPAGCGKTKIALEWALKTSAKKIYWICPRVQVCQGIFDDLRSVEYLPNSSIEIVTGEIKKSLRNSKVDVTLEGEEFSSDIIITTIDQIVNSITTHKNITTLMDFMNAHVVFDEYHEYINMQGFNLLFAELIEAKKYQQTEDSLPNTLLVSATPNPLFITKFLGLDKDFIIGMESFNESSYQIEFVEFDEKDEMTNPLLQEQKTKNCFVISNTATTAQLSFIEHQANENAVLFHSKFTKRDKERLFNDIFDSFKQDGSKHYDILRSGPVVQASLNISCDKMISEMSHAENFLQRLGRLDRFGERDEVNVYTVAITEGVKNGKSKDGTSRFLNDLDSLQSTKVWYEFLSNNLTKKTYTINELYGLYEKFYEDKNSIEMVTQDLVSALKKSVLMIDENILDPKSFPNTKKEDKGGVKIKKNSLRGNSLFVQMAKCQIKNSNEFEILDEYAYEDIADGVTIEVSSIEGYGDSSKNLIAFMAKKHHNIKEVKKAYKDAQLKTEARDPSTPIYLSYTLDDLSKVNTQPHEYAQYYAMGLKQPIGILSLQRLQK